MQLHEWTNVVGIKLCEITQKKAAGVKFKKKKNKVTASRWCYLCLRERANCEPTLAVPNHTEA